jgi:hypothetical protein
VRNILIEHNTIQNSAVFNLSARDLLNTRITLDINFHLASTCFVRDCSYSLKCQTAHKLRPSGDELRADGGGYQLVHGLVIVDIDGEGNLFDDLESVFQGAFEGGNDHNGVNVAF